MKQKGNNAERVCTTYICHRSCSESFVTLKYRLIRLPRIFAMKKYANMTRPVKNAKMDDSIEWGMSFATRASYGIDVKAIENASLNICTSPTKTNGLIPKYISFRNIVISMPESTLRLVAMTMSVRMGVCLKKYE